MIFFINQVQQPLQTKDKWTLQQYYSESKSPSKTPRNSKYWQEGQADLCNAYQAKLIKHKLEEFENNLEECAFASKTSEYHRTTPVERRTPQKQERVVTQSSNKKSLYKYIDTLQHLHQALHSLIILLLQYMHPQRRSSYIMDRQEIYSVDSNKGSTLNRIQSYQLKFYGSEQQQDQNKEMMIGQLYIEYKRFYK